MTVNLAAPCSGIYNVHEIIRCLSQHSDEASQPCNNKLAGVIDSEPFQTQTLYNDVVLPVGATYFYGHSSTDIAPTAIGAIIPDGATAQSNNIEYGPGRLSFYNGIVNDGVLSQPQLINGLILKGFIEYHLGLTAIREATLAENIDIDGITYKGDTKIRFRETGEVLSGILAVNQTIENFDIPAGYSIFFDNDGVLSSIFDLNGNPLDGIQSKSSMMN